MPPPCPSRLVSRLQEQVPAVHTLNRAHLPVSTTRQLALLDDQLRECKGVPEDQVRVLLQEPLLLYCLEALLEAEKGDPCNSAALEMLCPQLKELLLPPPTLACPKTPTSLRRGFADSRDTGRSRSNNSLLSTSPDDAQRRMLKLVPITHRTSGATRNKFCYHSYDEETDAEPEVAIWSRYEKLKTLGAGHFGDVFLARERCIGREVAVKAFERLDDAGEDSECSEGHLLNALGHPNLLRIFEVVETRGSVFVIMEFAPGATLSSHAKKVPRGAWIASSLQQVAAATVYCHSLGVLHGDLKPENVLVGGMRPDGCPLCLVSDFGHASFCVGGRRDVVSVGDPRYAAPEVQQGRGISPKSDVFMLGISGYELLTGGWLPFFQEKSVYLDSECPFYESTVAWFMMTKGNTANRMREGFDYRDRQRFRRSRLKQETEDWTAPIELQQLVEQMVSFQEASRPSAQKVAQDLLTVSGASCHTFLDGDTSERGALEYGLWAPSHQDFGERLQQRARKSQLYRLFLAAVSTSLHPKTLFNARLLFRWVDRDGSGVLTRDEVLRAAQKVGLDPLIAKEFFSAADIYSQGFVDFKNLSAILLDVESFDDAQLLGLLRSMVNRMRGPPPPGEQADALTVPLDKLKNIVCFRNSWHEASRMHAASISKAVEDIHQRLGNDVSPDLLLGLLKSGAL